MIITLVMLTFLADGQVQFNTREVASLDLCFRASRQYVLQDPATMGGVALGAGCKVERGSHS